MPETHALTVRLPGAVYRAARRLAQREGISLNRLVTIALAERARRSTVRRLKDAYDELGRDLAEADSERFISLQAEALLDG